MVFRRGRGAVRRAWRPRFPQQSSLGRGRFVRRPFRGGRGNRHISAIQQEAEIEEETHYEPQEEYDEEGHLYYPDSGVYYGDEYEYYGDEYEYYEDHTTQPPEGTGLAKDSQQAQAQHQGQLAMVNQPEASTISQVKEDRSLGFSPFNLL